MARSRSRGSPPPADPDHPDADHPDADPRPADRPAASGVSGLIALAPPTPGVYILRPPPERLVLGDPGQAEVVVECVVVVGRPDAIAPDTLELRAYRADGDDLPLVAKAPPVQGTFAPYLFDVVVDPGDDDAIVHLVVTAESARDGRRKPLASSCVTVRRI